MRVHRKESDSYPIGLLDGKIEVHFVHYDSFADAVSKWKERCSRINWDNIYVMLVQRDGCTEENIMEFLNLPFENKIVLAADAHEGMEQVICIPNTKVGAPGGQESVCLQK